MLNRLRSPSQLVVYPTTIAGMGPRPEMSTALTNREQQAAESDIIFPQLTGLKQREKRAPSWTGRPGRGPYCAGVWA
jgi:hypothetical protein